MLNKRQREFVHYFVSNHGNATQAAISAGYSEKTARTIGAENLTKPDIVVAIEARLRKHFDRLEITELGRLFVRNVCMEFDAHRGEPDSQALFSRTV